VDLSIFRKEESFQVLFTQNPQPKWILDCRTLRFLEVNAATEAAYGYSREEFQNMTLEDLSLKEDLPNLYRIRDTKFKEPGSFSREVTHITKSGELVYREIVSYKVNFEGHAARLAVVKDTTERKGKENALSKYITQLEKVAFYNSYILRKPVADLLNLVHLLEEKESCPVIKKVKEGIEELDKMLLEINHKLSDPEQFK